MLSSIHKIQNEISNSKINQSTISKNTANNNNNYTNSNTIAPLTPSERFLLKEDFINNGINIKKKNINEKNDIMEPNFIPKNPDNNNNYIPEINEIDDFIQFLKIKNQNENTNLSSLIQIKEQLKQNYKINKDNILKKKKEFHKRINTQDTDFLYESNNINYENPPINKIKEIYVAYKDYKWMMQFVETMLERIAVAINGKTKFEVWGNEIEFKAPYRKLPMLEAIKEYAGVDIAGMDEAALRETCKKLNVPIKPEMGKGKLIDAIFGEYCEKNLVQPTFIIDYPVEMSPLTKRHRENPDLTERFELFVNGKELANAYSELNDPIDQLERFNEQVRLKDAGDDEAMYIDMDFVRALEYGMPPTSGLGMGIDRLTMMMTNSSTIQDVLFFPQMRPEK